MASNLVITGIPRSGTSYVCALLNSVENTVLVNEPVEALQYLRNDSSGSLTAYYRDTRQRILDGLPIQNKIVDGKFIEDTNETDIRNAYVPAVKDAAFVFGSKNTFVYLVCLEKIRRQLPDSLVLACVRHPYDVIASWKRVRFPHLKNANPVFFLDYAGVRDREEIARIGATREVEVRYALMWDFLAKRIIDNIDDIMLVKYEEFVVDPARFIALVYDTLGVSRPRLSGIAPSSPRVNRGALSETETQAVRKYCAASAGYFGYEI